jgi:hypothetical protein
MFMDWKGLGKVTFLSYDWMTKKKEKGNKVFK